MSHKAEMVQDGLRSSTTSLSIHSMFSIYVCVCVCVYKNTYIVYVLYIQKYNIHILSQLILFTSNKHCVCVCMCACVCVCVYVNSFKVDLPSITIYLLNLHPSQSTTRPPSTNPDYTGSPPVTAHHIDY